MTLSRRDFLASSALASGSLLMPSETPGSQTAASQNTASSPLTVATVIERIKQNIGVPWQTPTVDRLIVGAPDTPVHAIASVMMSTFEVCKRAQQQGANLIITHEPTFYLHEDKTGDLKENPVLLAKQDFLAQHNIAIFRLHDNIHAMHPDGIAKGMMQQLGWQTYAAGPELHRFHFPGIPLAQLAQQLAAKLHAQTIRVVGDPNLPVHTAAANWGYASRERGIAQLADPTVDLLIAGEAREWEVVEYAQDAITAGQKKALILLGHVLSEQAGMIFAADWLKTFIPEVPVHFVPTPEPFWSPAHPPHLDRA